MSLRRTLQREWKTQGTPHGDHNKHDSVGVCLTADWRSAHKLREGYVTVFTDTPEFPTADSPTTFESVNVHLGVDEAREMAARLLALADELELRLGRNRQLERVPTELKRLSSAEQADMLQLLETLQGRPITEHLRGHFLAEAADLNRKGSALALVRSIHEDCDDPVIRTTAGAAIRLLEGQVGAPNADVFVAWLHANTDTNHAFRSKALPGSLSLCGDARRPHMAGTRDVLGRCPDCEDAVKTVERALATAPTDTTGGE